MPRGGAEAASLTADGPLSWGGGPTPLLPLTHSLQGRTHLMGRGGGAVREGTPFISGVPVTTLYIIILDGLTD